jgi:hypothetical protein
MPVPAKDVVVDLETSTLDAGSWRALTSSREKFDHYAGDSAFRHGWAAACEVFGVQRMALLARLAVLVVQPDGLAAGSAMRCLDYLEAAAFVPLAVRMIRLDESRHREMWRFQSNVATYESLVLGELVCTKSDSAMLLLRDDAPTPEMPASVRLTGLKGHSHPSRRQPTQLRSVLGALNWVFVMVHCSDEPIDVVRELAVVMDRDDLAELLVEVRDGFLDDRAGAVRTELDRGSSHITRHPMSVDEAIATLRDRIRHQGTTLGAKVVAQRAAAALMAARTGERLDWQTWSRDLRTLRIDLDSWDVLLVASEHIAHELPGTARLIESMAGRQRPTLPIPQPRTTP